MSDRQELAEAWGGEIDPLAEFQEIFEKPPWSEQDLFGMYLSDVVEPKNLKPRTLDNYNRAFRQWQEYFDTTDRHYALPSEEHVTGFIQWLAEEHGNGAKTTKDKLTWINSAFRYWQRDATFPHGTEFNPITTAEEKYHFPETNEKEHPNVPMNFLRAGVRSVTDIRDRAILVLQIKCGLRATEVSNIKLSEVHIQNSELLKHYGEMGSSEGVDGYENCVYIPSTREGNKSKRSRLLPLDDETRTILQKWLLIRPDNGLPWLFLSDSHHRQIDRNVVNRIWTDKAEFVTDLTSHFGRHYFTTHWKVHEELPRELVKYMRGDKLEQREAIDDYLHAFYEDIEETYRQRIYKLNL